MTVEMFDSTNPAAIPANAQAAAGYVGGRWPTYAAIKAAHPTIPVLAIAIDATEDGDVLDVESGDASPADCPGWFVRQKARGLWLPKFYANLSTMPAVMAALSAVPRAQFGLWAAHYTYSSHVCRACGTTALSGDMDATQWTDLAAGCDQSTCNEAFFATGPPPATSEDDVFIDSLVVAGVTKEFLTNGMTYRYLTSPADTTAQLARGVPIGKVQPNFVPLGYAMTAYDAAAAGDTRPRS